MNYLSFEEFVEKYGLKDEATSNVKLKEVLDKLTIPVGIYMRDDKFTTDSGIVNLHPLGYVYKPKLFRFIWLSTTTKYNKTN